MKTLLYAFMTVGLLFCCSFVAEGAKSEQLEDVRERIEKTTKSLAEQKSAEKNLLRDLSVAGTKIKQIDRRIDAIRKRKKLLSQQLESALSEQKATQLQLKTLEKQVNKRLVALYKEGELGPLKLFFSAKSPTELVQQYQYLSQVLKGDRALLEDFSHILERQQEARKKYILLQKEQEGLLAREKADRAEIAKGRTQFKMILTQVKQDKKKLARELAELVAREKRLKKLVKQLKVERKVPSPPISGRSFAALKGALPWPINGAVSVGFGTQKNADLGAVLESHGIEIDYRSAQPVKAVASGRIVFASWFKGYGNLMILAHDAGYHTLYAQVEKMLADVGDVVEQGAVIAQTGPNEGQGLYFEIRHNGTAVNPSRWLSQIKTR